MEWDLSSIPNAKQYDLSSIPDAKERPEVDLSLLPDQKKSEDALSMAATFDIQPSVAYRNYDSIKKGMEDKGLFGVGGKSFMAGIGDVYSTTGSALKWMGVDEQADIYGDFGKRLQKAYSTSIPPEEFTWRRVMEPEWWATSVARSVPFTLSLMPAAILAAYGGGATATAVGLGTFGRLVLGSIGAAAVSRPLESALEAGNTYQSEIDKGKSEAEAEEAANYVFKGNLALTGMDVAEFATAFTPLRVLGGSATKSLARRILATGGKLGIVGGLGAVEEGYQDALQRWGVGDEVKFDPSMKEAMTIGGIFGVGMGGTGSVYTALRDKVIDTMPPDMNSIVNDVIQEGLKNGLPQQQAELKALDEIADTPEGKEHIEQAMETLKDPTKEVEPVAKVEPEEKVAPEAISQAADPLQYKTAEEFVKGQKKVYHGTTAEFDAFEQLEVPHKRAIYGEGFYFTDNLEQGNKFASRSYIAGRKGVPNVKEARLSLKNPLEIQESDIHGVVDKYSDLIKYAKGKGHDGIIVSGLTEKGFNKGKEYIAFDSTQIKTKAQLTDIWNKAQEKKVVEKVEQPPVATEEPITEYEIGELNKVDEQITAQASRQAEINVYKKLEKGKAKDEREIEKMAEADIKDIPVYRAMAEIKRRGGLNLKKISYQHSAEDRAQLTKKYPGLISKTGKEALDTIAEEIGYTDDNTLMDEMLAAPTKAEAKQKYIDDFYANYYGDMIEAGEDILPMLQAEESKLLKEATKKYKIKPAKGLKKFIREDTGQVKVKEIIEVKPGEILEFAMKEAQKAARVAFRAGDKEGVAKAKAKYREAVEKKKFREDAKNYIKKLAKQISKEPGASIDFFYREAIENLQAGIDPSFRAKKTLKSRERTREFLSRYPEAAEDMPTKLLKKLDKTSLNELTVGELEEISEKIDYLREVGKLKRGLKLKAATRQHDKNVEKIVAGITNNEPIDITKEPVVFSTTKEGKIDKIRKTARAISLRPSRIFDKLDGAKAVFGDITHKLFYDDVNVAVDKELRKQDERFDGGTAKRENLGITLEDLSKTRKIGGVDYRVDEMIGVYCAAKNPLSQLAIMYGNNISEEIIPKIIDGLTTQEKAWGDYIISDYEANFVRLRESVIETRNEDIGHQENYTPMRRVGIDYKTSSQEIMDEVLMKNHFKKGFAESGFRIDRKSIPPEFQKPINLNVTGVWFDQVYKQEHYIHFAKLAKELNRIVDDKNFSTAVDQTFGKEYHTAIRHYVDRIANPNIYKAFSGIEKASRALRQNMVMAYLSGNIVTIGKQLPSVFFYLRDATPRHLFGAMAEFITDPMKMIDFVKSKDPQLKHRMIEREMEELKSLQRDAYDSIIKKVGKIGMKGIYTMDRVATTIGWKGVYDRALVEGKSEAEAIRLAQNATLRTQPAAHAKDIAELYATNEFLNWFTQFTNQLNQIYNIATYDIPADIKGENYYNALMSSVGMALGALAIWVMTHRRLPETEEDVVDAFKEQTINAIPLFSKAIMAGTSGWKGSTIPVMKSGESLGVLMSDTTSRAKKRAMIEAICVTAGIPYTGPRRLYKAMSKQDARELIGGKPRD